jgi:coproporphyrinogen III oxidase-like Fe-S oxidoreductase
LGADRIALFGYAHVPWMKKNQRLIDEADLPSAGARLEQVRAAHKALEHLGYVSIGFDHFAKPDDSMAQAMRGGTLRRNFQGYTTDTAATLIGFGASSIGKLRQGYVQNAADIGGWRRSIEAGTLPVARGFALSAEDRLRGAIIEELLTGFQTDLARMREGAAPSQAWINQWLIGWTIWSRTGCARWSAHRCACRRMRDFWPGWWRRGSTAMPSTARPATRWPSSGFFQLGRRFSPGARRSAGTASRCG